VKELSTTAPCSHAPAWERIWGTVRPELSWNRCHLSNDAFATQCVANWEGFDE